MLKAMPQRGREAVPYLIRALEHPEEGVRRRAAQALGGLESAAADAVAALRDAANDPADSVHRAAQQSSASILSAIESEKRQAEDVKRQAEADKLQAQQSLPPETVAVQADTPLMVNDDVSVEWHGGWYPGRILELPAVDGIRIHYEGFDASWDETVPRSRLRRPVAPAQPEQNSDAAPQSSKPDGE
jgi:hypothetical protein